VLSLVGSLRACKLDMYLGVLGRLYCFGFGASGYSDREMGSFGRRALRGMVAFFTFFFSFLMRLFVSKSSRMDGCPRLRLFSSCLLF
jgi:hypothetical protein